MNIASSIIDPAVIECVLNGLPRYFACQYTNVAQATCLRALFVFSLWGVLTPEINNKLNEQYANKIIYMDFAFKVWQYYKGAAMRTAFVNKLRTKYGHMAELEALWTVIGPRLDCLLEPNYDGHELLRYIAEFESPLPYK
jgi:hypothetical protein